MSTSTQDDQTNTSFPQQTPNPTFNTTPTNKPRVVPTQQPSNLVGTSHTLPNLPPTAIPNLNLNLGVLTFQPPLVPVGTIAVPNIGQARQFSVRPIVPTNEHTTKTYKYFSLFLIS
jgi:hypothetical protein